MMNCQQQENREKMGNCKTQRKSNESVSAARKWAGKKNVMWMNGSLPLTAYRQYQAVPVRKPLTGQWCAAGARTWCLWHFVSP